MEIYPVHAHAVLPNQFSLNLPPSDGSTISAEQNAANNKTAQTIFNMVDSQLS
jgi:hypothetical protein